MSRLELVGTHVTERTTKQAVEDLFTADGEIYLVTGYFTASAYYDLRTDIVSFLNRSPDNRLTLVVGSGIDQFSAFIARSLWKLDTGDQVQIYTYPYGFLHAKLYVRTGDAPRVVIGSTNLTRGALEQNLELGAIIRGESIDDPDIRPFLVWIEDLLAVSDPLRRRDLFMPVRVLSSLRNWANKGRLLPLQHATRLASVRGILLLVIILALFAAR